MSVGRMFEYTPVELEKRLRELSPKALEFIQELPTFLCSEISQEGIRDVMLVKFGRINALRVKGKEVLAAFRTIIDFRQVPFADVKDAVSVLALDRFQPYRTHWAIRNANHFEILQRLAAQQPNLNTKVMSFIRGSDEGEEPVPPDREKNIIGTVSSVEEFLALLAQMPEKPNTENFFRGHEDVSFELTPSLLRRWPDGAWRYLPNEDRLCRELLIAHYDEFQSDQYCFDRLVRMQHYGLPTRLLDISENPLVALFFACFCAEQQLDEDGEVILFRINRDAVKYFDSDTVSCVANISNLSFDQKGKLDLTLPLPEFNDQEEVKKLLHFIRSEKGYFEPKIVPDHLNSIICVKAKRNNIRIKSQSGAFLLFGHQAVLPEGGTGDIEIGRITVTDKRRILSELDRISINATTVYPSIEQTTVHLRKGFQIPRNQ